MNWADYLKSGYIAAGLTSGAKPAAAHPPVIAISGSNSTSKSVSAMMSMVRALGGAPVFIGNFAERSRNGAAQGAAEALRMADGVMIMGNDGDIDPRKYGAEVNANTRVETDPARAAFEEELIRQSIEAKVPLFGVCGGMQRINVLCGGTLHQHLPELVGDNHHAQGDFKIPAFVATQEVDIRAGTALSAVIGQPSGVRIGENSFHHQAVNVVPEGLAVNAVSADGVAEGFETAPAGRFRGQYIVGVQWHPEFAASEVGPKLVDNFLAQARIQSAAYPKGFDQQALEAETLRSALPDIVPEVQKGFAAAILAQRQQGNRQIGF